jgi:hypothetical protein
MRSAGAARACPLAAIAGHREETTSPLHAERMVLVGPEMLLMQPTAHGSYDCHFPKGVDLRFPRTGLIQPDAVLRIFDLIPVSVRRTA